MADTTLQAIVGRVSSVLASSPFSFTRAQTPFGFELQPTGLIDQTYTVQGEAGEAIGGFGYTETRVDRVRIGVARTLDDDATAVLDRLTTDATSMVAAITRDGAQLGGDYDVADQGRTILIEHDRREAFAVLRVILPVDYEAQL
jgi:hypothetical protein